jgi:[acyl-carrier-protein] S-malonyltransferase
MESAQKEFQQAVDSVPMTDATIPVIGNVSAAAMSRIDDLRADLQAQLTSRVRWTESVRWMIGNGVVQFIEVGNGSVLTGLLKRIDDRVAGIPFGFPADLERLKDHLGAI